MFLKSFILLITGLASGVGVAAGTFAFLLVIRVLPRMIQKAKLNHKIVFIENIVIRGLLFGTILSLFTWKKRWLFALLGKTLLTIYGLSAGIFAGCISVALAEILDTFPIFFRRLKIEENYVENFLFIMAIGKMVGSLFYFFAGYAILGE
ncbi:MAG: stage V sporulation protein AB [Agathobacter sp.]